MSAVPPLRLRAATSPLASNSHRRFAGLCGGVQRRITQIINHGEDGHGIVRKVGRGVLVTVGIEHVPPRCVHCHPCDSHPSASPAPPPTGRLVNSALGRRTNQCLTPEARPLRAGPCEGAGVSPAADGEDGPRAANGTAAYPGSRSRLTREQVARLAGARRERQTAQVLEDVAARRHGAVAQTGPKVTERHLDLYFALTAVDAARGDDFDHGVAMKREQRGKAANLPARTCMAEHHRSVSLMQNLGDRLLVQMMARVAREV